MDALPPTEPFVSHDAREREVIRRVDHSLVYLVALLVDLLEARAGRHSMSADDVQCRGEQATHHLDTMYAMVKDMGAAGDDATWLEALIREAKAVFSVHPASESNIGGPCS
jgi:hypothetical protein